MLGAILAGGSILSSILGARSANRAADAQVEASEKAIEEQRRQFDLTWDATQAGRDASDQAYDGLTDWMGGGGSNITQASSDARTRFLGQTGRANDRYLDTARRQADGMTARTGQITDLYADRMRGATDMLTDGLGAVTRRANDMTARATQNLTQDLRNARGGMFQRANQVAQRAFEADPGYQFRLDEGLKARERSASARGNVLGAATQKELDDYSQGLASQEYGAFDARRSRDYQTELGRAFSTYDVDAGQAGQIYDARIGRSDDIYGRGVNRLMSTYGARTDLAGDLYGARMGEASADYGRQAGLASDALQLGGAEAALGYDTRMANIGSRYGREQDSLNRLSQIAGLGQQATGLGVQAGTNAANQISGLYGNIGQAQAAGAIGVGNAWNAGIDNMMGILGAAQQGMFSQPINWGQSFGFGQAATPPAATQPVNPYGVF